MLEILKAAFLGIVEGITEWLPVSSTGHLIIVQEFLNLNASQDFKNMFDVVIQLGAVLAVVVLYFRRLNPFSKGKSKKQRERTWILWLKVLIASIPAAVLGLLFNDKVEAVMEKPVIICVVLIVFGILFIVVENYQRGKEPKTIYIDQIDYKLALIVGMLQVVAMFLPGTSRSGITIVGGLLLGMSRPLITEFTFFLAIPVMFGASALKMLKFGFSYTALEAGMLAVGFAVAYFVSILSIKFLLGYIKKNNFKAFGYYRIVVGTLALLYFLISG